MHDVVNPLLLKAVMMKTILGSWVGSWARETMGW
jgi:hypothetical protein